MWGKIWRSQWKARIKLNSEVSSIPDPRTLDFIVDKWFSTMGNFAPRGHLKISGDIFGCYT